MWTQLTHADLESVKQELQARRSKMLARHVEELTALDVDEAELTIVDEAVDALVRKFISCDANIIRVKAAPLSKAS